MLFIILFIVAVVAAGVAYYLFTNGNVKVDMALKSATLYDFKVKGLDGSSIDFAQFKGKKILVVNTASKCGFTPQYEGLERLYKRFSDKLVIVGFPSNDFLDQEPDKDAEIAAFCQRNYGVTFPMAAKIDVKGKRQAPIYQWLTNKSLNGVESSAVLWNFQKYLIDENGRLIKHFPPKTDPEDPAIVALID
ncbi:glutathione peroxidase [Sphingobacterium sp. Ag1]|uniref:glutathione peroxidase n=1 Tax=Sphingobacterium sp. Ag1 TaxID=1643451 RepID=UPI00069B6125|nr:glutathione peroxidase [Sphingobacterium sp. Ag1]